MAEIWEQNEEKTEDEELVVTEHRDEREPAVSPEEEEAVEVPGESPREALEELGEDVSSSPAQRGHEELYDAEDRTGDDIPSEEAKETEEDREL